MTTKGLVAHAIQEALEAVASSAVADKILRRALEASHRDAVPDGGASLREFITVELHRAADELLGASAADAVRQALIPIVAMTPAKTEFPAPARAQDTMTTAPPPSPPPAGWGAADPVSGWPEDVSPEDVTQRQQRPRVSEPKSPAPDQEPSEQARPVGMYVLRGDGSEPPQALQRQHSEAPQARPVVFVATTDRERAEALSLVLSREADVRRVDDVEALLYELRYASGDTMVVLDCMAAGVDTARLPAVAQHLPPDFRVVLWGLTATLQRDIGLQLERAWIKCGTDATPRDVAVLVCLLLKK